MTDAEIRVILAENLKILVRKKGGNVSNQCRLMNVNRTQFNRYLSGESWPRPDVLKRIVDFYGVDANILLHKLENV